MNQATIQKQLSVLQARGGIITEKRSVWKMQTGQVSFKYFAGQEANDAVPFAKYNMNGKTPLDSARGRILIHHLELRGPSYKPLNIEAGNAGGFDMNYDTLDSADKLLSLLDYKIVRNKQTLKEGLAKSIHEPLPTVLWPSIKGTADNVVLPVSAVKQSSGNDENKTNQKTALYLPIDIDNVGTTLEISVELNASAYTIPVELNNCFLVWHVTSVEYPG